MRLGFVIDQTRCIGCHACTVACKEENRVPLGVFRTWVKYVEKGEFPNTRRHFAVLRCNHCDNAPCVTICPTVALYRRADGIVDFDRDRCIGCKSCMQACPYDALYIDPDTNTAAKCHFCAHRVERGLEPACVIVCPERAILTGDLDDPDSEVSRVIAREQVVVRKPEQGTRPKLFYVGADHATLAPTLHDAPAATLWGQGSPRAAVAGRARRWVGAAAVDGSDREARRHVGSNRLRRVARGPAVGVARRGVPLDQVGRGRRRSRGCRRRPHGGKRRRARLADRGAPVSAAHRRSADRRPEAP